MARSARQQYLATAVFLVSTLLNAAYFLPIVHRAFFRKEAEHGHAAHGEAPLARSSHCVTTAALTVLLFFYSDVLLALARQVG